MANTNITQVWRIEALYARLERARELVASGKVYQSPNSDSDRYLVESQTHKGAVYTVTDVCTCNDASIRHELTGLCKHMLARIIYGNQEHEEMS